jgi:hypothetical protein
MQVADIERSVALKNGRFSQYGESTRVKKNCHRAGLRPTLVGPEGETNPEFEKQF